jgi:predicted permease
VAQAALSVVLLFAAGIFVRSLDHLSRVRMGVDIDRVALGTMNLRVLDFSPDAGDVVMQRAYERVRAIPGVSHAALAMTAPFGASYGFNIDFRGRDSIMHADAMYNAVTPDYFKTLGTRLLSGRDFSPSDGETSPRVVIVNEMFATRYWGKESPVGQCVSAGSDSLPCATIVGVVENVRRQSIFEDSTNFVYVPLAQAKQFSRARQLLARVDRGNPAAILEPMRIAMQTAASQLPYADVHLLADAPVVYQEFRPYRLGAALFGVFGLLALALAAIGIYGVVSYNVGQRTREMGVRIALGAPTGRVARLVVRQGVAVTLIGVVIGIVAAVSGASLARPLLVDESARDPLVLLGVAVILVGTAVAASVLPARRAVRTDPAIALRSE